MPNKTPAPIIILGTGRSGTTVFMEALFRHSSLAWFSTYLEKNPKALWVNYIRFLFDNPVYRVFGQKKQLNKTSLFNRAIFKASEAYPVWEHLVGEEIDFSRSFLLNSKPSPQLIANVHKYVEAVRRIQHRERFALKITGPGRIGFLNELFPDAKFIWLKRDFIATLNSFLKVNFWKERKTGEIWWRGAYSREELQLLDEVDNDAVLFTALQLQKIIDTIQEEVEQLGLEVLQVDYEQFVEDPEHVLRRTLDFCDLSHDSSCFQYVRKNEMVNRNKPPTAYFNESTLKRLEELLNRKFII